MAVSLPSPAEPAVKGAGADSASSASPHQDGMGLVPPQAPRCSWESLRASPPCCGRERPARARPRPWSCSHPSEEAPGGRAQTYVFITRSRYLFLHTSPPFPPDVRGPFHSFSPRSGNRTCVCSGPGTRQKPAAHSVQVERTQGRGQATSASGPGEWGLRWAPRRRLGPRAWARGKENLSSQVVLAARAQHCDLWPAASPPRRGTSKGAAARSFLLPCPAGQRGAAGGPSAGGGGGPLPGSRSRLPPPSKSGLPEPELGWCPVTASGGLALSLAGRPGVQLFSQRACVQSAFCLPTRYRPAPPYL